MAIFPVKHVRGVVNEESVSKEWCPACPGRWLEMQILQLPAEMNPFVPVSDPQGIRVRGTVWGTGEHRIRVAFIKTK